MNHEKYNDLVLRYHVSKMRISQLITKARKNKAFIQAILSKAETKAARSQVIEDKVMEFIREHQFIDSVDTIKDALPKDLEKPFKNWEIRQVMRSKLNMKYKKVVPVSVHANSEKNLVLRQQFAIKFISILQSKSIIINVDESWIGQSDFRQMKWQAHGDSNSVAKLMLAPRITLILALGSDGSVVSDRFAS